MLSFIITVKSKTVTKDWATYKKLVERTIKSTCNQTNLNFETIVVCHEKPEIDFQNPKVHFLQVDWEAPIPRKDKLKQNHQGEVDKGKKLLKGTEYAKKLGATYIMTVDSDDCVSDKLAGFIQKNEDKNIPGWYVKKGFLYKEGSNFAIQNLKNFNDLCGTCVIIKPDLMEMMFGYDPYLLYYHQRKELSNGKKLLALPFPGAIYSIGNGQNFYMSMSQAKEKVNHKKFYSIDGIKLTINKIKKYRPKIISAKFKKEFGLYPIQ